jgi:hypothetical protein
MVVLLFGVKFCKNGEKLPDDATWKDIVLQLMKGYPLWVWIIVFFVFQPAIVHIINLWAPSLWINCAWIPKFSDFFGLITIVFFFIIFYMTDDYGKLKLFKQSE